MLCYVTVPGNQPGERIGIVKWVEDGYYKTNLDSPGESLASVEELVHLLNERLGVPDAVAKSALYASMFGWNVPAAAEARAFAVE